MTCSFVVIRNRSRVSSVASRALTLGESSRAFLSLGLSAAF